MAEEQELTILKEEQTSADTQAEVSLPMINSNVDASLVSATKAVADANTKEDLEYGLQQVNINMIKKNTLRVAQWNELLGKLEDQALERIDKRPEQMSNDELIKFIQTAQASLDRSQKYIETADQKPMVQLNQQNNINIVAAGEQLSQESRERVIAAVNALLGNNTKNISSENSADDVIDMMISEENNDDNQ